MLRNKNNKESNNRKSNKRYNISNIEEPDMDIDMDLENSVCSSYDCTGLIPSEMISENELDNYDQMYQFLPPNLRNEDDF